MTPLSILQFAGGFPHWGGTELHLLNLSGQLARRGHRVTVACRPGQWIEARALEMGLPTTPITVLEPTDRRDLGKLYRWLRANRVDVLHTHWNTDFVIPPVAALAAGVPVRVMTRHLPHPLNNRRGARAMSDVLYSRVVTVSESVRRTLIGSGMTPGRVETIHHGTDVEAFARTTVTRAQSRARLGIPEGAVAVGIVGRIASEKGHDVLLEAVHALGDRRDLRVVVIGDGPDDLAIKGLAYDLGLLDRMVFAGFRADVNDAMSALDIVALPSTWAEPCSAAVQQAMALGKPVIGTDAGGTPEMVAEGETGLLVPPSDAGALAGAIAALAGDGGLRRRMGEAGRARVGRLFTLQGMTDQLEALYYREYARARGRGPSQAARQRALVP